MKDIPPENPVKGILDFLKCGMKVGALNFRISSSCRFEVLHYIFQKSIP